MRDHLGVVHQLIELDGVGLIDLGGLRLVTDAANRVHHQQNERHDDGTDADANQHVARSGGVGLRPVPADGEDAGDGTREEREHHGDEARTLENRDTLVQGLLSLVEHADLGGLAVDPPVETVLDSLELECVVVRERTEPLLLLGRLEGDGLLQQREVGLIGRLLADAEHEHVCQHGVELADELSPVDARGQVVHLLLEPVELLLELLGRDPLCSEPLARSASHGTHLTSCRVECPG